MLITSRPSPPVTSLPALKEWAPLCAAISSGRQTLLLRKGGLRDKGFQLPEQSARFLLLPTSFHSDQQLLAAQELSVLQEARSGLSAALQHCNTRTEAGVRTSGLCTQT